jgi:hypothetical protein
MRGFMVASACLAACTHRGSVSNTDSLDGSTVTVELSNGAEVKATVEVVTAGALLHTEDGVDMNLTDASKVTEIRRGRGALEGLGIGVLIGGAAGAAIGYADGDDTCTGFCVFRTSAEEKAVVAGIALGAVVGVVGLLVGVARGSRDVYHFEGLRPRMVPVGPPGTPAGVTIQF